MIVDAHVALDRDRFPVERALEALQAARIGSAVIFPDATAENLPAQNEYVLDCATAHGLFAFYYVGGNPWTDTRPDQLLSPENLDQYAGIRWHRYVGQNIDLEGHFDPDELEWAVGLMESSEFEAFMAAAAHYSLPVIFEESLSVTIEFATRFPSLDIIVPHLGAQSGGELNVLRALWDVPNVYFDTSLTRVPDTTLARVGSERILFASGLPLGNPELELRKIDDLPISEDVKERIYGENLLSLLSTSSSVPQ
jgi:hypothetical protein